MLDISLPSIPTTLLAAIIAFGLNSLKDWIIGKRRENDVVRDWYQQTITLCERINTTVELANTMAEFEEKNLSEIYDGIDIEDIVSKNIAEETAEDGESDREISQERISRISEEVEAEISHEITEASKEKLIDDITELFMSLREHIVNRPRDIKDEPEELDNLMTDLWGLQVGYEVSSNIDISARDIESRTSSIIDECETKIESGIIF